MTYKIAPGPGRPKTRRRYREFWIYERTERIMDLDERIAWRAAELGITLTEVAHRMGISQQCFSNWFARRKRNQWTRAEIQSLCKALEWQDTAPLHEKLPTIGGYTRKMLRRWKRNIAKSLAGGSDGESNESAESTDEDD